MRGEISSCSLVLTGRRASNLMRRLNREISMRHVHLVGSVPLNDARTVFETVSAALGPKLKRIPDGETGERAACITCLEPPFADNPTIYTSATLFRIHTPGTPPT